MTSMQPESSPSSTDTAPTLEMPAVQAPAVQAPAEEAPTASTTSAPAARPQVIVSVGTDHHPFDRMITWIDEWAAEHPDISVLVQRGTSSTADHCPSRELIPHPELLEMFSMADVVVSHGGPSTVMDARMVGRLPVVVARNPEFGEHVDGHQMRFADHLRRYELAVVINHQQDFFIALNEAIADPERFTVPVDTGAISGVVEFARVLDDLLGTATPLTPSSPAGAEEQLENR